MGKHRMGRIHLAMEIDPDIQGPIRPGHLHEGLQRTAGSCVVHQDIDLTEPCRSRPHHGINFVPVADISLQRQGLDASSLRLGGGPLRAAKVNIRGDDIASLPCQNHDDALAVADLAAGAGHQCRFAV